jgi:hypothetical protein
MCCNVCYAVGLDAELDAASGDWLSTDGVAADWAQQNTVHMTARTHGYVLACSAAAPICLCRAAAASAIRSACCCWLCHTSESAAACLLDIRKYYLNTVYTLITKVSSPCSPSPTVNHSGAASIRMLSFARSHDGLDET